MSPASNETAVIRRLILLRKLPATRVREITVKHDPWCPAFNPKDLEVDCSCHPSVWLDGQRIG